MKMKCHSTVVLQAWSRQISLISLELRFFQVTIVEKEVVKGSGGICKSLFQGSKGEPWN